jgi:uridine kinase
VGLQFTGSASPPRESGSKKWSGQINRIGLLLGAILEARRNVPARRAALVAISGIDASGKGYVTAKLAEAARANGMRIAMINIDGWLNLPHVRFSQVHPAGHFYLHAIRFDEMFAQLVFPLRDQRSLSIEMDFVEETATEYRRQVCVFEEVEVILLEGIYLLKRAFQNYYDLSFWIDCSFETALQRAIARGQEGLPAEATLKAYRSIYFPAQEIHFAQDDPRRAATAIINNDPLLR